ncbi:MAG: excinuclease ABC subunit UvrC [Candidatus Zixiibacteriota bacterium]
MVKRSEDFELKLKNLPTSPGVYLFKNAQGRIIYIGKAKNLRNRVRTYFHPSGPADAKTARLVPQVTDFELMLTANEVESLILEANLVHEHKPKYNVSLKDDKHFPYIKVTTNESFPRVMIVRRLAKDGATYFGPFTQGQGMRRTLTLLTRLFTIRSCDLIIPPPEGKQYKVCLDYQMKRCGGPCEGLQSREEYAELVNSLTMVLRGRTKELRERLTERMHRASEELRFEDARQFRDQIDALGSIMIKQNVDVGEVVDRDIVSIARDGVDAVAVVMQLREGVLIGRQDFQLHTAVDDSNETVLETFVTQYYNHQPNLPEEVLLPLELSDAELLAAWLKQEKGSVVRIRVPKVGEKVRLVDLAARNAQLLLDEILIQRRTHAERTSKMVTSLKEALHLSNSPRTMVCFDISNTGETDAVGSCVFFENGRPKKSEYRRFRIKGMRGQDDFSMMRQVVGRYFYRRREENKPMPDLVVVDGGKGQLSSAKAELVSLGLGDQPLAALAKRLEELYLPDHQEPITIRKGAPALLLLKQIRDEAHRFAITYNRKVRTRRTVRSVLDDIKGVGPSRRSALMKQFGSVEQIRQSNVEEISRVKGITADLARTILQHLNAAPVA